MKQTYDFTIQTTFLILMGLGVYIAMPGLAFATGLEDIIASGGSEAKSMMHPLLSVSSYLLGAMLAVTAMFKFRAIADGQNVPWMDPIMRLLGGVLLIGAPWILTSLINSLDLGGADVGITPASGGGGSGTGLDQLMVTTMSKVQGPALTAIKAVCLVGGITFLVIGLKRLAQAGDGGGRAPKLSGTIGCLIAGACMVSVGQVMGAVTTSLFGSSSTGTFHSVEYSSSFGDAGTAANNVFAALFEFVAIIGWIAVARGIFLLRRLAEGEGQKTHLHAFTNLLAGACCVNMAGFVNAISTTTGLPLIK